MIKQLTKIFEPIHLSKNEIRLIFKRDQDNIVNNIKREMEEKGVSHERLADAIHSSTQHVTKLLKKRDDCNEHRKGMTIRVASRIASALNTTISDLSKQKTA